MSGGERLTAAEAEARLRAIRAECKGHLWKTLRMTPETLRACRDLFAASMKGR